MTNTEIKLISGNRLHKVIKENKTADNLAHFLAARDRIRGFTDLQRLNMDAVRDEKFDIDEKQSLAFFKALEAEGVGSIVHPRELGGRARFMWKYDMRKVCTAAIDGKDVYANELPQSMQRISDASRKPKEKVTRKKRKVVIPKGKLIKQTTVVVQKPNPLNQLNINGQNFIQMSEEEYNKLNKFKELLSQLGK